MVLKMMLEFVNNNLDVMGSAPLSDALDMVGLDNQVITGIRASSIETIVYGYARTLEITDGEGEDENFSLTLNLIEEMSGEELLVIQGSEQFAYFGGMMSTFSLRSGIPGVIIDGLTRDNKEVSNLGFPVFSRGHSPKDVKGRGYVSAIDKEIRFGKGQVSCKPADFVFADSDAVVVVPQESFETVKDALETVLQNERSIGSSLREGASAAELIKRFKSF